MCGRDDSYYTSQKRLNSNSILASPWFQPSLPSLGRWLVFWRCEEHLVPPSTQALAFLLHHLPSHHNTKIILDFEDVGTLFHFHVFIKTNRVLLVVMLFEKKKYHNQSYIPNIREQIKHLKFIWMKLCLASVEQDEGKVECNNQSIKIVEWLNTWHKMTENSRILKAEVQVA